MSIRIGFWEMLISVIVAVYNIEEYLVRCIDSILAQTCQELEILLIDDGSTDGSGKICDTYAKQDRRIRVIHRKNGGLSAARNIGLEQARGEYIAFVDGDDWLEPRMYESMLRAVLDNKAQLAVCRYRQIYPNMIKDGSTGKITVYKEPYKMLLQQLKEDEAYLIQHAAWNKLYHRSLLEKERFPEGKWFEDIVFSARVLSKISCGVYIDMAGYNYVCVREGSIMNAGLTERQFSDLIPALVEEETFLETLADPELVATHRYYFYKNLQHYYRELYKKENRSLRYHAKELVYLLRKRKHTFPSVYDIELARNTEKWKAKLFVFSPHIFRWVMTVNDAFILPLRLKGLKK